MRGGAGRLHWILQDFEDTRALAPVLDSVGAPYSWHKVVPFEGTLIPEPDVAPDTPVVLFGAYTLWRHAERRGYCPGVFRIAPFVHQECWHPHLLNGRDAVFLPLADVPERIGEDDRLWFMRPVDDSKAEPGRVRSGAEIVALARQVLALQEAEIPVGSLRPDTDLMLSTPVDIRDEWRVWVVGGDVVTRSRYRQGARVVYRADMDDDALAFARHLAALHPGYSPAYVMDICRTDHGLFLLETNCINAAGFYAADLHGLVAAIEALPCG